MRYLGMVKQKNGNLVMPDAFLDLATQPTYEAVQVGDDVLLVSAPLDRKRLAKIRSLTEASIKDHRATLEGLGR